jgi:primary-amine oxidase
MLTTSRKAAEIVRAEYNGKDLNFRVITMKEPPKTEMVAFLDQEHRKSPASWVPIRCARVEITLKSQKGDNELHEIHVDLDKNTIIQSQVLKGKHSYIDSGYMKEVEEACIANQKVQDEIKTLDLPPGASVVVEPWAYATDGENDMSKRVTMVPSALPLPCRHLLIC